MPTRIQHPVYGTVFSGDDREIKRLLEEGGVITNAPKEVKIEETKTIEEPEAAIENAEVLEIPRVLKRGRPFKHGHN